MLLYVCKRYSEHYERERKNMSSFGGKLKELRNQRRVSLRTLAKELDISPTFLSDIENGRRLPPNSEKILILLIRSLKYYA